MLDPRTTVHESQLSRTRSLQSMASASARPPGVGDVLGAYRLCVEIGGGGMASVYLAQGCSHSGVHRFVALKCIRPEFARNPRFVEMFLDEARIAAQIHHPNVCSVLDFDEHHGAYYLVMEFLSGQTLTAVHNRLLAMPDAGDPLVRLGVFARILESACEGLHAAHEALNSGGVSLHIVHRDVSPDNLFVTYDGNVKVMDFGVAYTSEHHQATRTGILKGKCGYLAPEVLAGAKPDRRADIWGLGVVAWEMMAQRKLFDQPNDPAILRAIGESNIPPPSTIRAGIPPLLDELVLRALERDPARRYQTARELGRMLNRFLVEYHQVVGLAEVSDFMRALFPEGIACTRQLVKFAELEEPPPRARGITSQDGATVADIALALELARRSAFPEGTPVEPPSRATTARAATETPPPSPTEIRPPRVALFARWSTVSLILVAVAALASTSISIVVYRLTRDEAAAAPSSSSADPVLSNFTLEAAPAGTDASGAMLLRLQLVRRPH
jgi:serine/threonine protein kinase